MATTTPTKLNVKAFAAMLDQGGQIGFNKPPAPSSGPSGNKPTVSPRPQQNEPKKFTITPMGAAAPFGRNTLNNRISVLKKTPKPDEVATKDKNEEQEIKISVAKKPPIIPRTVIIGGPKKPVLPPPGQESNNAVKTDTKGVAAKTAMLVNKENLEGIVMKKKLVSVDDKSNKRKSIVRQRPKPKPIPLEGILGRAPVKPEKPPIILELKRDTSAPLPAPPESDSESDGELYDDVEADSIRVSIIKPMDEEEEFETEDFYDDVEASQVKPARKPDPLPELPSLPSLPVAPVSNFPPVPIETETDDVYQDVSDEGEEIGIDEDIYETFDDVTQKRELSGSQETLSSTSSKGKDDQEKQRKKEELARKKHEEKERKEKERKEKEEKERLKKEQLEQKKKEKEELKKKKEEEKKMKKFFNLKGNESPVKQGTAINSYSGNPESHDLAYIKNDLLDIMRTEGNPAGKWLAKNKDGKYGYVEVEDIRCDGDDIYDDAMSAEIPEESDGEGVTEDVYECVDL